MLNAYSELKCSHLMLTLISNDNMETCPRWREKGQAEVEEARGMGGGVKERKRRGHEREER